MERSDYTVRKVELPELHSIRDSWKRLECGPDMTFFQKYEWYEMLAKFVPAGKGIECGFFVVDREGAAVMIAPLWIITRTIRLVNRPGVFLIGRKGYSDYLNLVYEVFDEVAFQALAGYVRTRHGVEVWHFEYLRESALLSHVRRSIGLVEYAMKRESSAAYCGLSYRLGCKDVKVSDISVIINSD